MEERLLKEVYDRFHPKVENPIVSASVYGSVGNQVYTYIVTVVSDSGETDGTKISLVGPDILSHTNFIVLKWNEVEYAKRYRVYGRTEGALGFLVETEETEWKDYGVIVPDINKKPPLTNTTGRLEWDKVVFLPGRYAQSAEMNEVQSILQYHMERVAKTLFREGDIINGCEIIIDKEAGKAYLTSGKVFIRGRVRDIGDAVLSIKGVGLERIGIEVEEVYVDADDDPILLDPAQNYPGYGMPGALRRIIKLKWVKDKQDMVTVYELFNGSVVKSYRHTVYSELEKTLAVRTRDISGDVVTEGFELSILPHPVRRDKVLFKLDRGKAYVSGFEVEKPTDTIWEEDVAKDEYVISAEVVQPRTANGLVYELDSKPVAKVNYVTGSFFIAQTRVVPSVRDADNWYLDTLPYASIDEVVGLWNNSNKQVRYQLNTHYRVVGNTIRLNPNTFSPGASYYIEYYYFRELTKGRRELAVQVDSFNTDGTTRTFTLSQRNVIRNAKLFPTQVWLEDTSGNIVRTYKEEEDFVIEQNNTETSFGFGRIRFRTSAPPANHVLKVRYRYWRVVVEGEYLSPDSYLDPTDPFGNYLYEVIPEKNAVDLRTQSSKPSKPTLIVGYSVFLPQKGYLLLKPDGHIQVLRGISSFDPKFPDRPIGTLPLYAIHFTAFGGAEDIIVSRQTRFNVVKVYDMNVLKERLDKVQYDLAVTSLELDALSRDTPLPKKGVFVDAFDDTSKMDFDFCNVGMDTKNKILSLPVRLKTYRPSVNTNQTNTRITQGGKAIKSYTRAVLDEQLIWTEDFAISLNPYGVFGPFGILEIFPSKDLWYETRTSQEIIQDVVLTLSVWFEVGWEERLRQARELVARTLSVDPWRLVLTSADANVFAFQAERGIDLVEVRLLPYMRRIPIYFRLQSMPSTEFRFLFADREVRVESVSQGELRASGLNWNVEGVTFPVPRTSGSGILVGKFIIPEGVPVGDVFVKAQSLDNRIEASAEFSSRGMLYHYKRKIARALVRVEEIRPQPVIRWDYDPLAQTFIAPEDCFIESIDVWFYSVPSTEEIVTMTIRTVEVGIPTQIVLGRSFKTRTQIAQEAGIDLSRRILIGEPSETNGRVRFVFDPPVFIQKGKEYCFSLDNSSPGFVVFGAKVGKRILGDLSGRFRRGQILDRQAHDGVLLVSVNARTWESYQDTDLMFRINKAVFSTTPQYVMFNQITDTTGIGEFTAIQRALIPSGCSVKWEWSSDGGATWKDLKVLNEFNPEEWEEIGPDKVNCGKVETNLLLRAQLINSTPNTSPVLELDSVHVYGGIYETEGVYETKNVVMLPGVEFENVRCWFWWKGNGGSIQEVRVSFNGGVVWYNLPILTSYEVRQGWREFEYGGSVRSITSNQLTTATQIKVRVRFSSSLRWTTPQIKNFKLIVY